MTKNRLVFIVTLGLVGKKLREGWDGVQIIIGLSFITKHVVFGEVIESAAVDRDLAGAVNLVVDVHEHIARASFVVACLVHGVGPCHFIFSEGLGITTSQSP